MMLNFDFVLRLLVAGILGAIIGLDREYRAKEAGYRTHFLVSLGSALIMIVSQYGFQEIIKESSVTLDPSRVAAQVVSGIGFIGAGTIIFQKQIVRGLTTAAEEQKRLAELEEEEEQKRNRRETYYGKDANAKYQRSRRRHIYIFNPEDLDNADIISMVENTPTYSRDKSTLNNIKAKAEQASILATEEAQDGGSGDGGVITF